MKRTIRLTEGDLRRIVNESVRNILPYYLNEAYNQFSDSDFASDGDPYGINNGYEDYDEYCLDGYYNSFNHIWVKIMNDGTSEAYIMVGSKDGNEKQAFEGDEAQRMLDKIRYDAEYTYGSIRVAISKNLSGYVL